eukprot:SAG31_NODE_16575_length_703_cov_1.447020_1_plen_67_part_10
MSISFVQTGAKLAVKLLINLLVDGLLPPNGCAEAVLVAARAVGDPTLNRLSCRLLASQMYYLRQQGV